MSEAALVAAGITLAPTAAAITMVVRAAEKDALSRHQRVIKFPTNSTEELPREQIGKEEEARFAASS